MFRFGPVQRRRIAASRQRRQAVRCTVISRYEISVRYDMWWKGFDKEWVGDLQHYERAYGIWEDEGAMGISRVTISSTKTHLERGLNIGIFKTVCEAFRKLYMDSSVLWIQVPVSRTQTQYSAIWPHEYLCEHRYRNPKRLSLNPSRCKTDLLRYPSTTNVILLGAK